MPLVDWSQLPYDLLVPIANNLHAFEDFVSFSCVCHSWRFVYRNNDWTPSRRVPWLMVDENHSSEVSVRRFMSVWKNKAYNLSVPEADNHRFWGTTLGWIVTIDQNLLIRLVNPISHVCFDLPTNLSLKNTEFVLPDKIDWFSAVSKAAVFKIRSVLVTMIIYGLGYWLGFYQHHEGSSWVTVPLHVSFVDAVCFGNQVFALSNHGELFQIEIDGHDPPRVIHVSLPPQDEDGWNQKQLVQSSEELLMIFFEPRQGIVPKFMVYKFDFNAETWMVLQSLGERTLFVDDSQSFSVSAGKDFKANSIYFAINIFRWSWALFSNSNEEFKYCGVYYMEDQTIDKFSLKMCSLDKVSPNLIIPTWLIPNFS